ncbi:MAG: efflux RND transporter periplasmic adaptor subunit, partial [Candidatus Gastranaerophilaceae bacterium]
AKFTVKAEDLLKYRKSSDGNHFPDVKVELQLADNTIYNEGGQLDFVDNKIEEDLGTIMLRATFPNKNKVLIPNDFVKVILTSKQPVKVAIIPQKAVLESVNSKFVWIIDENGRAKQQDIKVGNAYGDYWILTEGLNIGDTIISSNIQKIHQGSKVEKVEKAQTESTEHKKK